MTASAHQERHFEAYIVDRLRAQGWEVGDTSGYDTERALYAEDLLAWMQATQPAKWSKLLASNQNSATHAREALMDRLAQALDKAGTLHVLRRGFSMAGCGHIDLSETAPEDRRNNEVLKRYAAHRLRVVPQLAYHPARKLAIDLVFFINGLPVATVEVKTDFTQSADAAVAQYKSDRLPLDPKTRRREPLLSFKRGAVVHFAMSDSEIQMATRLDGDNTWFLPFNQGHEGRAGNPPRKVDGEYPVAYFWEQVCQRDAWLRIFQSFVYVEHKDVVDLRGNWSTKETLIFPRFHQWSAVNAMVADARAHGPGMQYLCEHSAGSGKTSTIAWTAHDLIKLRRDNGDPIFHSVIIVTDRNVLDSQLQEAVQQIDHQFGVIAAIDRQRSSKSKSKQLAEALLAGTPIIVVTIQTFPYAMEAIVTTEGLKDRSFAVIIDEAHASQTGSTATKLQAALALGSKGEMAGLTVEELLERLQQSRVRPKNISHFAFTATPKHSTFMLFGRTADGGKASKENLPHAFHRYPMRQAIEEGFILDVLRGYVPYQTAFNLTKQIADRRRVSARRAKRALAQWMSLHPTNVTQKVQFIIEHFSKNVAQLLDGKAKAMVVTSSRAAAVRYKKGFDRYIERHPEHAGIRSLVAFSGKLTGKQVRHFDDERLIDDVFLVDDAEEFTETSMNPGVAGQDLRIAFDRPEYRVMLVADKFQTGFDQPRLVAMYIDKKIANEVEVVQTLSRLNRTAPGKDETYIIDFVNEAASVRQAFAKYDAGALIDEVQDLNVVYEIKAELDRTGLYQTQDLESFKQARFSSLADISQAKEPQHKALYAATEPATRLFNERLKAFRESVAALEDAFEAARQRGDEAEMKAVDHRRKDYADQLGALLAFKSGLGRFCRSYAYIAQLIDFGDPELENFAAYAKLLQKRLNGVTPENVDLKGLVLSGFDIKSHTEAEVATGNPLTVKPMGPGGGVLEDTPSYLKDLIEKLNRLFGEATPLRDQALFVNHIAAIARENELVIAQVQNNSRAQALMGNLPGAVQQGVVRALASHQALATLVLKADRQGMSALTDVIYDLIRARRDIDLGDLNA
jgi:type I restriction enzyme R subunit